MKRPVVQLIIFIFMLNFVVQAVGVKSSIALSGSAFTANKIIPDSVFFNPNSLSINDIQKFLDSKVPICDTNGIQMRGNISRAQYGTSQGYPVPYTCLKDYRQDTNAKPAEPGLCNGYTASNQSSAEIIYTVAKSCGLNPKVLIVLLQKEQALVTDDWPWSIQYRSATGYGCPDTAPCDTAYYGYFNQVYNAARQYKKYARDAAQFNYRTGRDSFVQYNPNSGCGGTNLTILNQATAGLYNYTPYQPNQAALNNLYGTGDNCSAYGNRNFWRLFNDYFGSSDIEVPYAWALEGQEAYVDPSRTYPFTTNITTTPESKIYLRIRVRNIGNETWDPTYLHLGSNRANDRISNFYDISWLNNTRPGKLSEDSVSPGQTGTIDFVLQAPKTPGTYNEYFNLVAENKNWLNDIGLFYQVNVTPPGIATNNQNVSLKSGTYLFANGFLLSADANSTLRLQDDGNLVLYNNFKAVWSSGTAGNSGAKLIMQSDGNLVLYNTTNQAVWSSGTAGNSGAYLTTQVDGNLAIYGANYNSLWSSKTSHIPNLLDFVNSTVKDSKLYVNQHIDSIDRQYRLTLQDDGNLVLYQNSRPTWATYTMGGKAAFLYIQKDGNLVLYDKDNNVMWTSRTNGKQDSQLTIQSDGNLVLYSGTSASWASNTAKK